MNVIKELEKPILGVCLGHQGIAAAYGGSIIQAFKPLHGVPTVVNLMKTSVLFRNLPERISVVCYNSLIVDSKRIHSFLNFIQLFSSSPRISRKFKSYCSKKW